MRLAIAADYDELSEMAAQAAAEYINNNPETLICLAAGDTPLGMLDCLVDMQRHGEVDLSTVYYAGLDEWVGLGPEDVGSCIKVMSDAFYGPAGIPKDRIHVFDGLDKDIDKQCRSMEAWISCHGGIGFALLGIGMNGHIGFNEPGTPDTSGCFPVQLDNTTKTVSAKYFGKARPVTTGMTIGWRTLLDAQTAIIMASGEAKAPIVKAAVEAEITLDIPATVFRNHKDMTVMMDSDAASRLNV